MGRCSGCSGDRCSCVIRAGAGTRVTGAGTQANPYVVEATGGGEGGSGFVPGMIMPFGGSVAPAGWLVANGQAVSRSAYSALFSAIGIVYGAGDASTTFNVPDLAGAFPFGADGSHAVGSVGGSETKALVAANIPAHTHAIAQHVHDMSHNHSASSGTDWPDHAHTFNQSSIGNYGQGGGGALVVTGQGPEGTSGATARHSHPVTVDTRTQNTGTGGPTATGSTGTGTAFNSMPPYLSVTYIIKT